MMLPRGVCAGHTPPSTRGRPLALLSFTMTSRSRQAQRAERGRKRNFTA
ncbi:hypothetical protein KYC5002_06875 [Archangium violaceum]|nr:hypothetical protein KYC5002_06875 [Archangium gephyra]